MRRTELVLIDAIENDARNLPERVISVLEGKPGISHQSFRSPDGEEFGYAIAYIPLSMLEKIVALISEEFGEVEESTDILHEFGGES